MIMLGTTFLENYYIFMLATDIVNSIGITEANPINVILDAHYNPRAKNTDWLPESKETDQSEYTGDWRDSYDHPNYEEAHYQRMHGNEKDSDDDWVPRTIPDV